jgi:putative DNA primase/helicase
MTLPRFDVVGMHQRLGPQGWRDTLERAGIAAAHLRNKHGACPICGGKDRFRFDNKRGQGNWICNQCGSGDGLKLLMKAQGLTFIDACKLVMSLAGIEQYDDAPTVPIPRVPYVEQPIAAPTPRVRTLLKQSCPIEDCEPARRYMESRGLWPLPPMHKLRAHPSVDYWQEGERIGHHPALLAAVRDVGGEVVTAHVTYLQQHGAKIETHEPRKILSGMQGRAGCAVRLMRIDGEVLGITEGIETALSAAKLHGVPVWAALNTSLLSKFDPPPGVTRVVIFADRDIPGMDAAAKLMQRLQGRVLFELSMPHCDDWNDALLERMA